MFQNKHLSYRLVATLFIILASAYTFLRAYLLAFTWDEAFTYLEFVKKGIVLPTDFSQMSANNHLMNTWLMEIAYYLGGNKEFILRLPNLLAGILYMYYAYKISMLLQHKWIRFSLLVALILNPFLLDFFSLARGYGLAIAFVLMSLYYSCKYLFNEFRTESLFLLLFASCMGVLANLSTYSFFFCLLTLLIIIRFHHAMIYKKYDRVLALHLFVFVLSHIIIGAYTLYLGNQYKKVGALFYGTNDGIWNGTIDSIVRSYTYLKDYGEKTIDSFKAILLITLVCTFYQLIQHAKILYLKAYWKFSFFIFILFVFILSALVFQYKFLNVLYLMQRTALFFMPLFILLLFFLLDECVSKTIIKKTISSIALAMVVFHFSNAANLYYCEQWVENADIKDMLTTLQEESKNKNISVGARFIFSPGIAYYRERRDLSLMSSFDVGPSAFSKYDYYLVDEKLALQMLSEHPELMVLKRYAITKNYILKATTD